MKGKHRRTKEGICKRKYRTMNKRNIRRGHGQIPFTQSEFIKWMFDQKEFDELLFDWKESGYDKWLAPSVDRLRNNIGYTLNNIQIVTWRVNYDNSLNDRNSGKIVRSPQRIISRVDNRGRVKEYGSVKEIKLDNEITYYELMKHIENDTADKYGNTWKY